METGYSYRSPTETEWEYACRAGSVSKYCFGNDVTELRDYAWCNINSQGSTHPVGQKLANAWGSSGYKMRFMTLSSDEKYLFCNAMDAEEGKPNLLVYSRGTQQDRFQFLGVVDSGGYSLWKDTTGFVLELIPGIHSTEKAKS